MFSPAKVHLAQLDLWVARIQSEAARLRKNLDFTCTPCCPKRPKIFWKRWAIRATVGLDPATTHGSRRSGLVNRIKVARMNSHVGSANIGMGRLTVMSDGRGGFQPRGGISSGLYSGRVPPHQKRMVRRVAFALPPACAKPFAAHAIVSAQHCSADYRSRP